jgi:diguanylate cyclase (GGDEF)-like protein
MSALPALNFGQSERSLFSPQEIARLMECEYRRSLRYGYGLGLCLVAIDRLESLHDLYGVDSRARIVESVLAMLRSSTRASDSLGTLRGDKLLVLFPHSTRASCQAVARRLLAGCRELEFRGDGRALRASLSLGLVQRANEGSLAALAAHAERALVAAQEAGGNRFVEFEELPAESAPRVPLGFASPPAPAPARAPAPRAVLPSLPSASELTGATLEERVRSLFSALALGGEARALEREVLEVLERTLAETRGPSRSAEEVAAEIVALEGRVAELKRLLDASEQELERMLQEKSADPGIASLYRGVQGLDPGARDYAKKKELLTVIYQANVELLRELRGQGRG